MPEAIERSDCPRCGGSGQTTDMVAGRSGFVPCPDCDNVPEFAVPSDPPEDPRARLEEIDGELEAMQERREECKSLRSTVREATDALDAAADSEFVSDDGGVLLDHYATQIRRLMEKEARPRNVGARKEQLLEERRKLETYVDYLDERGGEDDV